MNDAERAVWDVVRRINASWVAGRADDLATLLREDFVTHAPGADQRQRGRAAAVQSYIDFFNSATIESFEPFDPVVEVFGDTAVVVYRWRIVYTMKLEKPETFRESGSEIFVLARDADGWKAAWRMISPPDKPS
jgi:ketosteroid isomerase-like protein